MLPRRREKDLLVRSLSDETLVYDLKRDRAHCLNRTAAAIWQRCDGRTSIAELAAMLGDECHVAADEQVVWLALRQLQQARLLQERIETPRGLKRSSRRELIRTLGVAAAVPIVMTIFAPTAAAQASNTCPSQNEMSCSLGTCPIAGQMCVQSGMACVCV